MKKLTAKEILEIIKEHYSEENYAYNEWTSLEEKDSVEVDNELANTLQKERDDFYNSIKNELPSTNRLNDPLYKQFMAMPSRYDSLNEQILNKLGLGKVVEVKQVGGEGEGETWYSVKHFVDHNVYLRIDGFYASYNGTDFNDGYGYEVKPTQKTITVYEN